MLRTFTLLLLIIYSVAGSAAEVDFQTTCAKITQPVEADYCIHRPSTTSSTDLVYYLHGAGNSELTWQEDWFYTSQIRKEWARRKASVPTVVSVSFGPLWILAPRNTSSNSGLMPIFTQSLMPKIEAELGGVKGRRIVFGDSMGGFNSVQLALTTKLFQKAAIICAPMADISPFSNASEIKAHVERSAAWQYYKGYDDNVVLDSVNQIIRLSKAFFPTEADWKTGNPLSLAETADPKIAPQLYVAVGFYDKFAAYEGNELFVDRLISRGFKVDWRPQWGGHCAIDIQSLADFLVR